MLLGYIFLVLLLGLKSAPGSRQVLIVGQIGLLSKI